MSAVLPAPGTIRWRGSSLDCHNMPIPFSSIFWTGTHGFRWPGLNETQRFLVLSIHRVHQVDLDRPRFGRAGAVRTIVSPAVGALIAVLLTARIFKAAKGSGVNDTKAAVYISNGLVPSSAVIGKFLACSVSIGTGNSLGPEAPALHMGSGVASLLGRLFHLPRERMRLIAPVGAAAGLAAAFNTPIAAVLFVIEEVVAGWSAAVLGSIVLSAVSAAVVVRWFPGSQPLFLVPEFALASSTELLLYALVGLVGGLLSVIFVKAIGRLRAWLERFPRNTTYLRSAAADFAVGLAGIWLPEVMGAGYGASAQPFLLGYADRFGPGQNGGDPVVLRRRHAGRDVRPNSVRRSDIGGGIFGPRRSQPSGRPRFSAEPPACPLPPC